MKRRSFVQSSLSALAVGVMPMARAQGFPSRQVELVVPYSAAGSTDIVARLVAAKMAIDLGQSVVVDNRAGGNGNVGSAYVAKSPADGHRLLLGTNAVMTLNPHLNRNIGFDPLKDLAPVALVTMGVLGLAVSATLGVKSLAGFVDHVKKNPQKVFYGAPGSGSPQHVIGAMLNQVAGIDMTVVQYKGFTPTVTDLIGGNIQLVIATLASLKPYADSGRVQVLAVAEAKRFDGAPNIPAIAETYRGFEASAWNALFVPAATPKDVVARLNASVNAALKQDDVRAQLNVLALPVGGGTPEQLAALVKTDYTRWGKLIKSQGIQAES